MFKLFVFAAIVSYVSASGHLYAPVAHTVAVAKTVEVPHVVGYGEKVVGQKVVGGKLRSFKTIRFIRVLNLRTFQRIF